MNEIIIPPIIATIKPDFIKSFLSTAPVLTIKALFGVQTLYRVKGMQLTLQT